VIHRVIVNERREVDQLHHRSQGKRLFLGLSTNPAGQQEQRRPEQFPLKKKEMLVDLFDHGEVGHHNAAQLFSNPTQILL